MQFPEELLVGLQLVGRLLAGQLENHLAGMIVFEFAVQLAQRSGQRPAQICHGPVLSLRIPARNALQGQLEHGHPGVGEESRQALGGVLNLPALQGGGPGLRGLTPCQPG